jgi:hypothetical protein
VANKRRSSSSLVVLFGSNTIVPLSRANPLAMNLTTTTTRLATTTTKKTVTTATTSALTATTVFSGFLFYSNFRLTLLNFFRRRNN